VCPGFGFQSRLPVPLFRFEVFQTDSEPCTQTGTRLLDPLQKSWIVFEPIVELPRLGLANIPGRIVLDLRERNLIDAGVASCASRSASNLARWEKPSAVYIAVNRDGCTVRSSGPEFAVWEPIFAP
jgi:hypothetical protein